MNHIKFLNVYACLRFLHACYISHECYSPLLHYTEIFGEGFIVWSRWLLQYLHSCYVPLRKMSCSQTSPSMCSSYTVKNGVCSKKGVILVGDVLIFVVERRSATLAEFWKLDTVELVRCNDVCGVIRGKINLLFVRSELQPIHLKAIFKLPWW